MRYSTNKYENKRRPFKKRASKSQNKQVSLVGDNSKIMLNGKASVCDRDPSTYKTWTGSGSIYRVTLTGSRPLNPVSGARRSDKSPYYCYCLPDDPDLLCIRSSSTITYFRKWYLYRRFYLSQKTMPLAMEQLFY